MSNVGIPFFSFYPADWLSGGGVQQLTLEETGAYINLLAFMWQNAPEVSIPDDNAHVSRLLHITSRKWVSIRRVLVEGAKPVLYTENGRLRNKRLDEEYRKAIGIIDKKKKAASKRWEDADAMHVQSTSNADAMQMVCHTDLDTDIDKRQLKSGDITALIQSFLPHGISSNAMHDIFKHMDKGLELELLRVALQQAKDRNAKFKGPYVAGILRDFLNDGITTFAQYQEQEAQRQTAAGGVHIELTATRGKGSGNSTPTFRRSITEGKVGRI